MRRLNKLHPPILGRASSVRFHNRLLEKLSAMHATGGKLSTHLSPADDVVFKRFKCSFLASFLIQ